MKINKIVVVVFVLCVTLSDNLFAQDKIVDQIVAVVGSNVILKSEIEAAYLQNQAQGMTSDGDMKCEILENLMIEKLMVAEAELDTLIEVTDNQINQQLDMRIQYFIQHLGSEKEVENYFKKPIVQLKSELKDIIHNELLSNQMKSKVVENVTVTPSEVRYFFKNLPEDQIPVVNAQYEYAQITLIPAITEAEESVIKEKLRDFKRRAEAGENFSMFAVLYSECPSSKNGGDLGLFGKATMDPAFSAAAFALKPGQISNVVKSEAGYHIIQMNDRMGDKIRCKHILLKPKVKIEEKERLMTTLDSIANLVRKNDISFDDASMRYSMDKNSRNNGGLVVHPGTMSSKFDLEMLPPDISKVLTKLNINEISAPFFSTDETGKDVVVLVKLINKSEAHKANISEDYQLISDNYLEYKKNETIQTWISKRQSKTYIRIDDTFLNCEFKFKNWKK